MSRTKSKWPRRLSSIRTILDRLEEKNVPSGFRSIDGSENNLANVNWGAANTQLLRNTTIAYDDGISTPGGVGRPNPRAISNAVVAQGSLNIPSQSGLTQFVFQWGQFLDHDLDLSDGAQPAELFSIPVPTGDPVFDPMGTGTKTIGVLRSIYDTSTGTSISNPRQQVNQITSFLDGSNIYGSDDVRALALRTMTGGRLKTSAGDLLPFNTMGVSNANPNGVPDDQLFAAGDIRANEQPGLTSMHTLFVREHNYWADRIATQTPSLSDEEIYQQARQIVIGEIQAITFNEFLPTVLGSHAISPYSGYSPSVNPSIANVFSAAAYRVGHTMLPSTLARLDANGNPIPEGNVLLRDAFFTPERIVNEGGIDPVLRGLAANPIQEIDSKIVDDVRNFLFDNAPSLMGMDLAAINIQRGRDHGLPSYNQVRLDFGMPAVTSFSQITSDVATQTALQSIYGSVDNVDVWVGGISEDHAPGSNLGPLFGAIWKDQFQRSRDGDRFWYQRVFSGQQLADIDKTRLSDIVRRNTGITNIQQNVFMDRQHQKPQRMAVGADAGGGPHVKVFDTATGAQLASFFAYDAGFRGGVRVAMGDVNGDGTPDLITAAGVNGGPHVKVFDGVTFAEIRSFFAYSASFRGGVFVAAGDINNDGFDDIVTGADAGGGPHVRVFSGKDMSQLRSFFAYSSAFAGGVRVASGDVDGDGKDDIVTGAGPGGGPHVEVFSGATGAILSSFFAYDAKFTGGVYVSAGDSDGDGMADVVTGAGAGGSPHVKVWNGSGTLLQSYMAFQPAANVTSHGVRVGTIDFNGDGRADLITGMGPGDSPVVEVRDTTQLTEMERSMVFDPSFLGGVFVGGA